MSSRWSLPMCILFLGTTACGATWAASFAPVPTTPVSLQVTAEGPAEAGVPPPQGLTWYRFANHTHTEYSSDSTYPLASRIADAAAEGADAISITDHGNCDAGNDPNFVPVNGCVPMLGLEWGSTIDGDAGLLNLSPGGPVGGARVPQMIPLALARGATIIANHPFIYNEPWIYEDLHLGIKGIEVWTNVFYTLSGFEEALSWWHGLMAKGRIITGIGGADWHLGGYYALKPCNYVLSVSNQPDEMQDAIEAGRITISSDEATGRCFLWCDADGDGTFETLMGGNVPVSRTGNVLFRIEAYDAEGSTLRLFNAAGLVNTFTVGAGTPWRLDVTADVQATTKDFVRAELRRDESTDPLMAVTNPIYIHYTPDDADSDGLADAVEQAVGSDYYDADTDDDGATDGFEAGYDGDPSSYDPYNALSNPSGGDLDLLEADTDGDGMSDGQELAYGSEPLNPLSTAHLPVGSPLALALAMALAARRRLARRMQG